MTIDRCPTCGRSTGTLMQQHPDAPGLLESLRGEGGELRRVLVTIALCVLVVLLITGGRAVLG